METAKISHQMLCAIGENLVSAHLMAQGWPTSNVNHSINNFKGIDLYCQKGIDAINKIIGIQVKTSIKGGFPVGITNAQAADLDFLQTNIVCPWVFVHIKTLRPLDADYYVLPRQAVIDILYKGHDWYLNQWNRPATDSLKKSPAVMQLRWLQGNDDSSNKSAVKFVNPYPGDIFRGATVWSNIW